MTDSWAILSFGYQFELLARESFQDRTDPTSSDYRIRSIKMPVEMSTYGNERTHS